jgi:hypothetical protein
MRVHDNFVPMALIASSVLFWSGRARAVDTTAAECVASSAASIESRSAHKLRAERGQLLVCAAASCPADIQRECIRRLDGVTAAIPTMIFEVRDSAGNDLSRVKVTVDGALLADRLDGFSLPVDPGVHTFVFESAGQTVQKQLVIHESEKKRREPISFGTMSQSEEAPQLAPTQPPAPLALARDGHSGLGMRKKLAITAGALGAAGLGAGVLFGALAWSKRDSAREVCPDTVCSDQRGASAWSDAKSWGNASTVAFIVGGAGVAAGAALWFGAKSETRAQPNLRVSLGLGALDLQGSW